MRSRGISIETFFAPGPASSDGNRVLEILLFLLGDGGA